jgi:hypothetical protein
MRADARGYLSVRFHTNYYVAGEAIVCLSFALSREAMPKISAALFMAQINGFARPTPTLRRTSIFCQSPKVAL